MIAPSAWRIRCYDSKARICMDRTIYEPLPDYERHNLEHHFTVHIDAYALVREVEKAEVTANFIAAQADRVGEVVA